MIKAINIQWDFDDEEIDLPNEIEIPDDLVDDEEISDYISDVTGFCHKGFELVDDTDDDDYDDIAESVWDSSFDCYECGGYGDDYYEGEDGELICRCPECPLNPDPDAWNV